ncbi:MAG TPA: RDD family protein [Polyangiaceae bacterium]|nr:RDD family protein [Polyangiaceae bacterium]
MKPDAPLRVEILTPEHLPLPFEVAPAGSRLVAFLLDLLLIALALLALGLLALLALGADAPEGEGYAGAIVLLASFVLRTFYFAWSELAWRGQTFGKRRLGLRVIARDGGPLTADMVFARNLTRDLEVFLPLTVLYAPEALFGDAPGYARLLGGLWLFAVASLPLFNRHRARAGDLVAGTLVVVEPTETLLPDLVEGPRAARAEAAAAGHGPAFTAAQLDVYGIKELQVLEDVLRRDPGPNSDELYEAIAKKVKRKIGWTPKQGRVEPEAFLRAFYAAQRARLEHKMLLGKRQEQKKG